MDVEEIITQRREENKLLVLPYSVNEFWRLFQCDKCGGCCDGSALPVGSKIRLGKSEVRRLANLSRMSVDKFRAKYCDKDGHEFTMNYPCPFYNDECTIYEARPVVCKAFPLEGRYPLQASPHCPSVRRMITNE